MKRIPFLVAGLIGLALSLAVPAHALRQTVEGRALSGLEENLRADKVLPQPTFRDLEAWIGQLGRLPRRLRELYGWLEELPAQERKEVLRVVSAAYRSFGRHMTWTERDLPKDREQAVSSRKEDKSWVTEKDKKVQKVFNQLVRRLVSQGVFPEMSLVGEEASVEVRGVRWQVFRDPIDGTNAYRRKPGQEDADHYTSTLTLMYIDSKGRPHPVLTMVIAPEYRLPGADVPGFRLMAGLGIDGVLVNGRQTAAPSRRSLGEVAGGVGVLRQTLPFNHLYMEILQKHAKGIRVYGDAMAMFEIPLSVEHPELPGIYWAGEQPLWDALPTMHLVLAMGGRVTDSEGKPIKLTRELMEQGAKARIVPRLLSVSASAHRKLLVELRRLRSERTQDVKRWLRSPAAKRFLLPKPVSKDPFPIPYRSFVEQQGRRILSAYTRNQRGQGKRMEGFSGPDEAGHGKLAEDIAQQLRRMLEKKGKSDVNVIVFYEDWLVRSRLERARWFAEEDPRRYRHRDWIRREELLRALDQLWESSQEEVTFENLYDRADGRTDHERKIKVGANTIVLVVGTYPMDQEMYPRKHQERFSHHTVVGVDAFESLYRHAGISRREPPDLVQLYQRVYLPRWDEWLDRVGSRLADPHVLAIDLNRGDPLILHYGSRRPDSRKTRTRTGLEESVQQPVEFQRAIEQTRALLTQD